MAGYLPAAAAERAAQYAALGLSGPEALYRDVPESVRLTAPLNPVSYTHLTLPTKA